jgi:hypothetical protein
VQNLGFPSTVVSRSWRLSIQHGSASSVEEWALRTRPLHVFRLPQAGFDQKTCRKLENSTLDSMHAPDVDAGPPNVGIAEDLPRRPCCLLGNQSAPCIAGHNNDVKARPEARISRGVFDTDVEPVVAAPHPHGRQVRRIVSRLPSPCQVEKFYPHGVSLRETTIGRKPDCRVYSPPVYTSVAPFQLLVLLLSLAACSKTAMTPAKPDAAADASATGADSMSMVLSDGATDAVAGPDVDPLACARTLSGQEDPGFPLTWATAQVPTAWCGFSPSFALWSASENPGGYNQVVLSTQPSGEMAISYEAVYLYDSTTGMFVQELWAGPFPENVTCTVRAMGTPLSATMSSVPVGGMALATYCPGTSDAGS